MQLLLISCFSQDTTQLQIILLTSIDFLKHWKPLLCEQIWHGCKVTTIHIHVVQTTCKIHAWASVWVAVLLQKLKSLGRESVGGWSLSLVSCDQLFPRIITQWGKLLNAVKMWMIVVKCCLSAKSEHQCFLHFHQSHSLERAFNMLADASNCRHLPWDKDFLEDSFWNLDKKQKHSVAWRAFLTLKEKCTDSGIAETQLAI